MQQYENLKINVPSEVKRILDILHEAGYEAYIVGGCVRDSILGREPEDWDITTSALPEQVKSLFSHTVDTGIKHGTIMVLSHGKGYEITTYRKDGKYSDSRHPDTVEFTPSLEEDLKRRDFTINAFAYDDEKGVVDLFGGMYDIENKVIRCVGDADKRFTEDALRIMRAIRFAAQLSFNIEDKTYEAIAKHADSLALISIERIRVEFEKTLMSDNPEYLNKYKELGLSKHIVRNEDAFNKCFSESSTSLYNLTDEKVLRLAAFFKDIEPAKVSSLMRKMTYNNKTTAAVKKILYHKDDFLVADRRAIKRELSVTGPEILKLIVEYKMMEHKADDAVKAGDARCMEARSEEMLNDVSDVLEEVLESGEPYNISMLEINGDDLIEAGMNKGKEIGDMLKSLLEKAIDEPAINNKETLKKLALDAIKNG